MHSGATLAFLIASGPVLFAAQFQVTEFGAKGDGVAVDTAAIQRAIDTAAAKHGTVVFKPGTYLSGALFLKSGSRFEVAEGVTIRGIQALNAYPEMPTRVAGIEMTWPSALINVYQQNDVKITGKGTIDGDGKFWWDSYWKLRREYEPKGLRWASDYDAKRVRLIQIYKSSEVELHGLTLQRSGFWTVHLCYSNKITVDAIRIRNNIGGRGPSTDGIDVDSSSEVLVQHCDIECNDDALCLKAGRDADGLRVNKPTHDVTIRECTVRQGAAGVTIGSETSGGIHNIKVLNLHVVSPVPRGVCFKSAKTRGGTVSNIQIENLDLDGVAIPISITMNWNPAYSYAQLPAGTQSVPSYWKTLTTAVSPEQGLPHFRNVQISNIKAVGARQAFEVNAYENDPIENFEFDHLDISAKTAGTIADAKNWAFSNLDLKTEDGSKVTLTDCKNVKGLQP